MAKPTAKSKKTKRNFKFWQQGRDNQDLPSAWRLFGRTYKFFITNWKIIGGITLVYAICYFLLVRAVPQVDLSEYKSTIDDLVGNGSQAIKTLSLAGLALASVGTSASQLQVLYGLVLMVVFSLAVIWTVRHITAKKQFNLRDSFYRSQTPLVPYLALIGLISIQLIPLAIGSLIYSIITAQHIAINAWENLFFLVVWLGLSLTSIYWLVNSLMATYAVTLPGMYPLAALKATRQLVRHRRWFLLRKILFLPVVLFAIFAIVFLFLVAIAPSAVFWFYDVSLILALPIFHIYYYHLYRSLV